MCEIFKYYRRTRFLEIALVSRNAEATMAMALAVSVAILVLGLAVHPSAFASTISGVGPLNTATTQTPTVPDMVQPGCYVGTLHPFTITEVACAFNLPPMGGIGTPGG